MPLLFVGATEVATGGGFPTAEWLVKTCRWRSRLPSLPQTSVSRIMAEALQEFLLPGRASPLVWWNVFLNGGGRLALGLIAAALAIALAQRAAARR